MDNLINSNKNFLIIAIIAAIIAVGAGGFILGKYYNDILKEAAEVYESGEDTSKITEKETGKCVSIKNVSEKNQCWTDLAKEEKDENYCKKISADFPEAKGDCYAELAILKDDSLICEKIDSGSLHKSCLEYFEGNDEKDETADWETYRNDEYGYSFKYPKGWELAGKNENITLTSPQTLKMIEEQKAMFDGEDYGLFTSDITIYYYSSVKDEYINKTNELGATTLDELIEENVALMEKIGKIKINNQNATEVIEHGEASYYVVFIENNGHLYKIMFNNRWSKEELSEIENQILSTFKFTD